MHLDLLWLYIFVKYKNIKMKKIILFLFVLGFLNGFSQTTTLISNGSSWKYLDDGSNQGTAWYGTGFNDASWASGNAELGYGDGEIGRAHV